jgi:GRAM domain
MAKTPFNLEPNENPIDNWALWYHSPAKKAYQGNLYVTNQRVYFISDDKAIAVNILKEQVVSVKETKSMMSKCAEVKTQDGLLHTFDRGMLSAEKVVNAINQR